MVPVAGSDSCAQHQCLNDYLQSLVLTECEFTVNTNKCSTLCAPRGVGLCRYPGGASQVFSGYSIWADTSETELKVFSELVPGNEGTLKTEQFNATQKMIIINT